MADPRPRDEPYLSVFMRVQRGIETAQDLITAFPALEQAALDSSSAGGGASLGLTEQDCRRLLDYPDAEEEAANIRHVGNRSRAELVSTTLSRPGDLSDAELELFEGRFWADVTSQEIETTVAGRADATPAVREHSGVTTNTQPPGSALPSATRSPAWMNDLARQFQEEHEALNRWGFIALYDAEDRDLFELTVEDVLRATMINNGAKANAIARRWRLHFFDAPRRTSTANTTTTTTASSSSADEQVGLYGTTLRNAFRAFLYSAEWLNILQWDQGVRTDVFLVVSLDPEVAQGWTMSTNMTGKRSALLNRKGLAQGFITTTNIAGHRQDYFTSLLRQRVVNRHRQYFLERLEMLEGPWAIVRAHPSSTPRRHSRTRRTPYSKSIS
ncbi:hypothetical protein NKR19_g3614 [Coniochaeta hoffmannii]|uniref:Uncharacterized protein n=1 Tax=Coniochaeta hoffmannii TaxID=91930 RepID=A0AA38S8F0_9PEZI|nr:hypothetical protein NKR19_g3614 [Coniochaeta hoffmannii]